MADGQEARQALEGMGGKWLANITDLFSTLLDRKSEVTAVEFSAMSSDEFNEKVAGSPWVMVNYAMDPFGESFLLFQKRDAAVMVDLIIGGDGKVPSLDFSELHLSILEESASQIIKSFVSSLSTELGGNFTSEIKQTLVNDFSSLQFGQVAQLKFTLAVEDLVEGDFCFLWDGYVVENYFAGAKEEPAKAEAPAKAEPPMAAGAPAAGAPKKAPPPKKPAPPPRAVEEEPEEEALEEEEEDVAPAPVRRRRPKPPPRARRTRPIEEEYDEEYEEDEYYEEEEPVYKKVALPPVRRRAPLSRMPGLDFLMDINVKVTAVLGKTEIYLKDLLEMGVGSIIQLDKFESEPVELMVNNKLVGRGEIVVVDEKFGVKVTETISDIDRVLRG